MGLLNVKLRFWTGIFLTLGSLFTINECYSESLPKSSTPEYHFARDVYLNADGFTDSNGQPDTPTAISTVCHTKIDPNLSTTLPEGKTMVTFVFGLNGIMWCATGSPIYTANEPSPKISTSALQDLSRALPKVEMPRQMLIKKYVGGTDVNNITYQNIAFINWVIESLAQITNNRITTSPTKEIWKVERFNYHASNINDRVLAVYVMPEEPYAHFNYHFGAYIMYGDIINGDGTQYIEGVGLSKIAAYKTIAAEISLNKVENINNMDKPYSPKEIVPLTGGAGSGKGSLVISSIPTKLKVAVTKRSKSGMPTFKEFRSEAIKKLSEAEENITTLKLDLEPGDYFVWMKTSVSKHSEHSESQKNLLLMVRDDTCVVAPYRIKFPYVEKGCVIYLLDASFNGRSPFPKDQAVALVVFPRDAKDQIDVYKVYAVSIIAGAQTAVEGYFK